MIHSPKDSLFKETFRLNNLHYTLEGDLLIGTPSEPKALIREPFFPQKIFRRLQTIGQIPWESLSSETFLHARFSAEKVNFVCSVRLDEKTCFLEVSIFRNPYGELYILPRGLFLLLRKLLKVKNFAGDKVSGWVLLLRGKKEVGGIRTLELSEQEGEILEMFSLSLF